MYYTTPPLTDVTQVSESDCKPDTHKQILTESLCKLSSLNCSKKSKKKYPILPVQEKSTREYCHMTFDRSNEASGCTMFNTKPPLPVCI